MPASTPIDLAQCSHKLMLLEVAGDFRTGLEMAGRAAVHVCDREGLCFRRHVCFQLVHR